MKVKNGETVLAASMMTLKFGQKLIKIIVKCAKVQVPKENLNLI